jgi:TusA-related sulfurtransferase
MLTKDEHRGAQTPSLPAVVDARRLTITTAIAWALHEQFASLDVGDEIELETDPFPAIVPDLEAWCRARGHELFEVWRNGRSWRLTLRKGAPRRNEDRVAVVVSSDGLTELLLPLGFALAAALGGAQVSVHGGDVAGRRAAVHLTIAFLLGLAGGVTSPRRGWQQRGFDCERLAPKGER